MRGVIKNVENIKIESKFCLIHIGELFLVRKMVKIGNIRIFGLKCLCLP